MSRVDRRKEETYDVLYSSGISTYPTDIDVSRKYAKFLREHPEINEDDINILIESDEREEDYYGHGGGTVHTLNIVKYRPETDKEYSDRVQKQEKEVIDHYIPRIEDLVSNFCADYLGFGYDEDYEKKYKILHQELYHKIINVVGEKLGVQSNG